MIEFISTRGGGNPQNFEQVLLSGLAPDGGLYVPQEWPQINLESLRGKTYIEVAEAIMFPFIEGFIECQDFQNILNGTYSESVFRHPETVPLKKLNDHLYVLELFHGPTIAFKDVALQLLGRLFDHGLSQRDERVTIIGATSGDTGSAAIEGCRICKNADIFILFPHGRVSDVQRRQMTTVDAPNVHCLAIDGTFDDCQNLVKAMFNDQNFRREMNLSAVNSINWARIMAQIIYYVTSALKLGAPEQEINFVVPTGNFGNVFAAFCAKKMGVPIKLSISTNKNDILTRFFETGSMKTEDVHPSLSPSMDIQISSNFERYLFELFDRDSEKVTSTMDQFKTSGSFSLSGDLMDKARRDFQAFRCDDQETKNIIQKIHEEHSYILDPHSAVAMKGALEISEKDETAVSLACAHPAKFPDAVDSAIGIHPDLPKHLSDLMDRSERQNQLDNNLEAVQNFIRLHRSQNAKVA